MMFQWLVVPWLDVLLFGFQFMGGAKKKNPPSSPKFVVDSFELSPIRLNSHLRPQCSGQVI